MLYRADIDGLRAVSILLILIYHVNGAVLPGGFVGVDVFFVISGYLITTLIYSDLEQQRFSFVDFYARRIRRIFPAVLLVLIVCLIVGWNGLFAHEFKLLGKHIAASAGFVSNVVYQYEGGYFDLKSVEKPLLHLWSLAIEEQYYVIWPLVVWGAWQWSSKSACDPRRCLQRVTLSLGLGSLLVLVYLSFVSPQSVFFFLPARAWELCAGAALAARPVQWSGRWRQRSAWAGFALIAISASTFHHGMLYPGWAAAIPVLGAMALLASGPDTWISQRLLSMSAFVHLGRWSFAIYLWHWPLLYFLRTLGWAVLYPWSVWLVIPASIALAALTFYGLELPARRLSLRRSALVLFVLMAAVGYVGWNVYVRNGMDFRERMVLEQIGGVPSESSEGCLAQFSKYRPKFCRMHDDSRPPDVVLLGDSMAHNAFTGIALAYAQEGKNLAMLGWPGVSPFLLQNSQLGTYELDVGLRLNALLEDAATNHQWPEIVFAFRLPHEIDQEVLAQLEPTLEFFAKHNKNMTVVLEPPPLPFAPILCVGMPPWRPKVEKACELAERDLSPAYFESRARMASILHARGIAMFDAHAQLCTSGTCKLTLDGHTLYRTVKYLTEQGSAHVYGNFLQMRTQP